MATQKNPGTLQQNKGLLSRAGKEIRGVKSYHPSYIQTKPLEVKQTTGSKLSFEQQLYGLHLRQPHGSETLRVRNSRDVLLQMEAVKWLAKALCATIETNIISFLWFRLHKLCLRILVRQVRQTYQTETKSICLPF